MGNAAKKRGEGGEGKAGDGVDYPYSNRKVPYRSEILEMSKKEIKILNQRINKSQQNQNQNENESDPFIESPKRPVKLIFDTDIGTDVDDALALLMTLHVPESDVEVLGVTTVYGVTKLRTDIANKIIQGMVDRKLKSGQPCKTPPTPADPSLNPDPFSKFYRPSFPFPVVTGRDMPLGTHRDFFYTGVEGLTRDGEELYDADTLKELKESLSESERNEHNAARFIIQQISKYPGEVTIVSLGAMSNIALALMIEPAIQSQIAHIVYMGMGSKMIAQVKTKWKEEYVPIPPDDIPITTPGYAFSYYPNHNVSSDTYATMIVFNSGVKISVVNHEVTSKNWWQREETVKLLEHSHNSDPSEMKVVGLLLEEWFTFRSSIFYTTVKGTCPHDALTTLEAIYPGKYVEYVRGYLMIHEWAGFSSFVCDPTGPHRIGHYITKEKSTQFLDDFSKLLLNP